MFLSILLLLLLAAQTGNVHAISNTEAAAETEEASSWWQVTREAAGSGHGGDQPQQLAAVLESSDLYLRKIGNMEPGTSCYAYRTTQPGLFSRAFHEGTFCYPAIIVTGVRKAGTSAAFVLLREHPQVVVSGAAYKENCPFIHHANILHYFRSLPTPEQLQLRAGDVSDGSSGSSGDTHTARPKGAALLLDGCQDITGNAYMHHLLRQPQTLYVLLLRDFSDWAWSAYNFWCDEKEHKCDQNTRWAVPGTHVRSPQLFHNRIEADASRALCAKGNTFYRKYLSRLWAQVDPARTLVLATEALRQSPQSAWRRIEAALGLVPLQGLLKAQFDDVLQTFAGSEVDARVAGGTPLKETPSFASQARRKNASSEALGGNGRYEISSFQLLLPHTRDVLDSCWRRYGDCTHASQATNWNYSACMNIQNTRTSTKFVTAAAEGASSQGVPDMLMSNISRLHSRRAGLFRNTQCESTNTVPLTPRVAAHHSHLVLITAANLTRALLVLRALAAVMALPALCLADQSTIYVDAAKAVRVRSSSSSGQKEVSCADASTGNIVQKDVHSLAFGKLVWLLDDPLYVLWAEHVRATTTEAAAVAAAGKGTVLSNTEESDAKAALEARWEQWDSRVATAAASVGGSFASPDTLEQAVGVQSMMNESSMVQTMSYQAFMQPSASALTQAVSFLVAREPPAAGSAASREFQTRLHCAQSILSGQLAADDILHRQQQHAVAPAPVYQHLQHAYSSPHRVCQAMHKWATAGALVPAVPPLWLEFPFICEAGQAVLMNNHVKLLHAATESEADTGADAEKKGTEAEWVSRLKCRTRYSSRGYRTQAQATKHAAAPTVLLAAIEDRNTVLTRLVLEAATGLLTGSAVGAPALAGVFLGENFCGVRQLLVHAAPNGIELAAEKIKRTMFSGSDRAFLYGIPRASRRKCLRGAVRGFARAVLQIPDPYLVMWRAFREKLVLVQRQSKQNNEGISPPARGAGDTGAGSGPSATGNTVSVGSNRSRHEWAQYVRTEAAHLNLAHLVDRAGGKPELAQAPPSSVRFFSAEALRYGGASAGARAHVGRNVQQLVSFIQAGAGGGGGGGSAAVSDRASCAAAWVTASAAEIHEYTEVRAAFQAVAGLLCEAHALLPPGILTVFDAAACNTHDSQ